MMVRPTGSGRTTALGLVLLLALAGCGGGETEGNLASLDAQLANNAVDPALRGALEDQIVVDPELRAQSNDKAVRPADRAASGAVPVGVGGAVPEAAAVERAAGGRLMSAPAPVDAPAQTGQMAGAPATLGTLAREQRRRQGEGQGQNGCAKLDYNMAWSERLPTGFSIYPGARLMDAAGANGAGCALRAVSFETDAAMPGVIDFYYTQVRRAGYDAEHQRTGNDHVLGGTRGEAAYLVSFSPLPRGGTKVDLIVDGGR